MEESLTENETLSSFVQKSVRAEIDRRKARQEFLERGLQAIQHTVEQNDGIPAELVIQRLQDRWTAAKKKHGL